MSSPSTVTAAPSPDPGGGRGIRAVEVGGAFATLRRGRRVSPEFTRGLAVTLVVALTSTLGRVLVPVAVQQSIDRGIRGAAGPRPGLVVAMVALAAAGVVLTGICSYVANVRIFRATEAGLATLRVAAFRHVHDLSMLSQDAERRGALVARVTSDVDTISTFVQVGGLVLVLSAGQLLVATAAMAVYSLPLAALVWACFLPLLVTFRPLQRMVSRAYTQVRERVGELLAAVSESVMGADTIRAYAVQARTQDRIDAAVGAHARVAIRAQLLVAAAFSGGVLVSGLVVAAVVGAGTWLGVRGGLTLGELLAFLFLVQLFTGPVQVGTEVLNELQNALAGWRRVLAVLDTPADVADPGEYGVILPRGPVGIRFDGVGFAYPGGPDVLTDVDLQFAPGARIAVVGETGSGKTTLARLLVRLIDPVHGRVLLDGVDVRELSFAGLRSRVVLVPQEGFLLDDTLAANIAWGRTGATQDDVARALAELGLADWVAGRPGGLAAPVGQRGASLSAGERQLVALARAYLADPDLLVLDEATSAVDPATEVALRRALEALSRGRSTVSVAHRLSTAEAADLVVVVDRGRVVDVGPHPALLGRCAVYRRLHADWAVRSGPG